MVHLKSLYRYRSRWPIGITLLLFIIAMYAIPGHWPIFAAHLVPPTAIDRWVPFSPWWVWVYASYYFMLIAAFFTVRTDRGADLYIWDLIVTAVLGTLCFFLWPTEVARVPYVMSEPYSLSEQLLWLIRTADLDVNCAPSMHVAMSTVAAAAFARLSKVGGICGIVWTFAITYSTLATKQHYSIDAITGAFVGLFAIETVRRCRIESSAMFFAAR